MKYALIKRNVLEKINQSTMAGEPVASTYNDQQDYLNRIPALINEAIVDIRSSVKAEPVVFTLDDELCSELGGMLRWELPDNYNGMRTGGVSVIFHGHYMKYDGYTLQGRKAILIPKPRGWDEAVEAGPEDGWELVPRDLSYRDLYVPDGEHTQPRKHRPVYMIEYYPYPAQLPPDPSDNYDLDEEPDVIMAACCFAAANLVMREDEFMYATLYNEFESKLERMHRDVKVDMHGTDDVYAYNHPFCFGWWGW